MASHGMFAIVAAILSGALIVIGGLLSLSVMVLLTEVVAAILLPKRHRQQPSGSARPFLAVLIPAHNEGENILPTLQDVMAELGPRDRVLVVADNCSDDTANVARMAGAEVIERRDEANRGKGFALNYGIRHLALAAPEVVIMVDADCRIQSGAVDLLAAGAFSSQRPVQALYLMRAPEGSSVKDEVSEFTWRLKNWVRPLGLANLNLACQLVGTGMAFPWTVLNTVNLATGALTEDLKLGLDLAIKGHAPLFCPEAVITSHFASSAKGRETQQQRWEQGHRELILSMVPHLLYSAYVRKDVRLLTLALDLAVPPIFMLALLLLVLVAVSAMTAILGLSAVPFYIGVAAIAALMLSIMLAWCCYGRDALPPRSLLSIIPFVLSKLQAYVRILAGRRATTWVRTDRN